MSTFFAETTTPLGASSTFTGAAHDVGVTQGANVGAVTGYSVKKSSFSAIAFADQIGVLRLEMSNDNTTWRRATADTALVANGVVSLTVPILARYYRAVFVNDVTAQGAFFLNSGFADA